MAIPWKTIKEKYIAGATQREICAEFGIGRTALTDRIRKEHWSADRTNERTKADKRTMQIVRRTASAKQAVRDAKTASGTAEITRLINRLVQATDTAIDRFNENTKAGPTAGEQLAGMVKTTIQLYREAYDVPTAAEAEARASAGERLQLEREKVRPPEDDKTVRVIIAGDLDDYTQ